LQVSGANYNRIYTRRGFTGGGLGGTVKVAVIARCPGLRILRAEENLDGVYPPGWKPKN
jgi:hypothetical protein